MVKRVVQVTLNQARTHPRDASSMAKKSMVKSCDLTQLKIPQNKNSSNLK